MHVDINGGNVGYLLWALHNQVSIMQCCPPHRVAGDRYLCNNLDLSQHCSAVFVHNAQATKCEAAVHTCMHAN